MAADAVDSTKTARYVGSFLLLVWIFLFPLLIPATDSDRGIFVSVAERLLAGDRLYVDVYDNKEPFFYLFVAAQRFFGGWAEILAEVVQFLICGVSAYALLADRVGTKVRALIAFGLVPLILAGFFYIPGGTHLPGTAMTLASCALARHRMVFLAGLLIGTVGLVKIVYLPLAGVLVLLFAAASRGSLVKLVLGATLGMASAAALLALRGELLPFVSIVEANIVYSGNEVLLQSTGLLPKMRARLVRIDSFMLLTLLGTFVACAWASHLWERRSGDPGRADGRFIDVMAPIAAGAVGLVVLAWTAMWYFHFQILYVASVLALVAVAPVLEASLNRSLVLGTFSALFLVFVLSAGYKPAETARHWRGFSSSIEALRTVSPETSALLSLGSTGSYARIGDNYDHRHAWQGHGWKLKCPRFHQYWFESASILESVVQCARTAEHLIVARTFLKRPDSPQAWAAFVDRVEEMLAQDYRCSDFDGVRACRRTAAADRP